MDDDVVFGPELAYMGLHGNHAAAAGSGCGCRPAKRQQHRIVSRQLHADPRIGHR